MRIVPLESFGLVAPKVRRFKCYPVNSAVWLPIVMWNEFSRLLLLQLLRRQPIENRLKLICSTAVKFGKL